jgi:hypothetical protein
MPPPKKGGKHYSKRSEQDAGQKQKRAANRKAGAPRSPLRAVSVLCHGCVLDRGSVRCVKARVLGCCAFSVLCQGNSAWLLCATKSAPCREGAVPWLCA